MSIKLFFSSTCATYGIPSTVPITENELQKPINPYGASKLFVERILSDYASAYNVRSICLRYFIVAGADHEGEIGEIHEPETHLIPLVIQTASGIRDYLEVYGNDYPTIDGTCIRDYICRRPCICSLCGTGKLLFESILCDVFNLGTGNGFSIKQVISAVEKISSRKVTVRYVDKRPGDPPVLIANAAKANNGLGWYPKHKDIDSIISDAWKFHKYF